MNKCHILMTRINTKERVCINKNWYYLVQHIEGIRDLPVSRQVNDITNNMDQADGIRISTPIMSDNPNHLWIDKWIGHEDLQNTIKDINHKLKNRMIVDAYMDGSLTTNRNTGQQINLKQTSGQFDTQMGVGVYFEPLAEKLNIACSLTLWPSFTRVELIAIFLAILAAPTESELRVHTDS
jgi:hypothetical protein